MSFCQNGLNEDISDCSLAIQVNASNALIRLSNQLNWQKLFYIAEGDLKKTAKGQWWKGRKLKLRIHLSIYLLQQYLNLTDRGVEDAIHYNALYQVFCGKTIVSNWHCPDHTKIEHFRSRLSAHTQSALANEMARTAVQLGFADPTELDIDSTVQEANIQYPTNSTLLVKCAFLAKRIQKWIIKKIPIMKDKLSFVDLKKIKYEAKKYFFITRYELQKDPKIYRDKLKELWCCVADQVMPVINVAHQFLDDIQLSISSKQEVRDITNFIQKVPNIIDGMFEYLFCDNKVKNRIYSLHLNDIHCFNKGKAKQVCEFGRQFQIGRLKGNFVYSIPNTSIHMPDAGSLKAMVNKHIELFQTPLYSICTDKGYYSKVNEQLGLDFNIEVVAISKPNRKLNNAPNNYTEMEAYQKALDNRGGLEAVIGHIKHGWQMDRSRMKSDQTTESAGYAAMLGFNIRQLLRGLNGKLQSIGGKT